MFSESVKCGKYFRQYAKNWKRFLVHNGKKFHFRSKQENNFQNMVDKDSSLG